MVSKCPYCGKDIKDEEAVYCPYCARRLGKARTQIPELATVSGFLLINAACFGTMRIGTGLITVILSIFFRQYQFWWGGLVGVATFALGLIGGINALKRKDFMVSLYGAGSIIVASILELYIYYDSDFTTFYVLFNIPATIFSILSLIFLIASRKEFSS